MWLLDTNVVSELRKVEAGKADPNFAAWCETVDADDLYISAITVMELEMGILRLERKDEAQGSVLRQWFDQLVLPEFSERVLAVDTQVAQRCAQLHVPDPKSERDALIAATALVHGMPLVTRNTADFRNTSVSLKNPWLLTETAT
ncbi:Toxin FitB [Pseudovibrio sp. Ad14]|nr:Toxin FitB [Pseudovibrio sp. W74]KZL06199.1 Toxin FitB [Pseudovibrio sp. Ad14]